MNNVGIQNNGKTVFTFDGESGVYDGQGHQFRGLKPFQEGSVTLDMPVDGRAFGEPVDLRRDDISAVCEAVLYGTRQFMALCGVRRVVVGISGGIDSSVVAALYSRMLDPADLLLVNMPGRFTSPTTRALARGLAENIGALYAEVPIEDSVNVTVRQLDRLELVPEAAGPGKPAAVERIRDGEFSGQGPVGADLAALAAAFGGVFTCNANKAEATVGYTTLYGDLAGYLANLADLWKGDVYALGRHLNESVFGREVIPAGCFDITPSAELSPAQDVDRHWAIPSSIHTMTAFSEAGSSGGIGRRRRISWSGTWMERSRNGSDTREGSRPLSGRTIVCLGSRAMVGAIPGDGHREAHPGPPGPRGQETGVRFRSPGIANGRPVHATVF